MKGKAIRKGVFIPAFSCVLIAGAVGLINNQLLISLFKGAFELAYQNLSWLYQWIVLAIVIICVILTFSKVGNIRIGGPDAKPKYGFWSWFAMSLTGGIGASIVSSSISQPITFLQSIWGELDGYGIEPGSSEAVLFALGRSFHEWSVFPYAFYGICSISIAYLCFNKKQPVSLSTLLVPLFGDKVKKRRISSLIDAVNILALALALVGTLGTFIGLTSACAKYVYNMSRLRRRVVNDVHGDTRAKFSNDLREVVVDGITRNLIVFIKVCIGVQSFCKLCIAQDALAILVKPRTIIAETVGISPQPSYQAVIGSHAAQTVKVRGIGGICVLLAILKELALRCGRCRNALLFEFCSVVPCDFLVIRIRNAVKRAATDGAHAVHVPSPEASGRKASCTSGVPSKLIPTRKFSSRKNLAHSSATARPFVWMAYCTVTRFWLYFRTVCVKNRKKSSPAKVGSPP